MLRRTLHNMFHPKTTVRWRLTLLYGGLFLLSGAALLAITYTLVAHAPTTPPRAYFNIGVPPGGPVKPPPNTKFQIPAGGAGAVRRPVPSNVRRVLATRGGYRFFEQVGTNQRITDLHHIIVESGIALGIMAIISGLLGWLVAGRVLRPLRTMTATTQQISEENLHERLAMRGPRDELRQLADTIDGLLARLEAAFEAERRFVANASHELRTPLTAARAMLEMVLSDPDATVDTFRRTCKQVLEEGEQQEQLIDALLALAQGQRGIDRREPIDLAHITADAIKTHELEAAARGLKITSSLKAAPISGDRRLIGRLVSNLVENAIRHNNADGQIEVAVRPDGEAALLQVANDGPAIPEGEIERLTQPFQRLVPDRTSYRDGLGLGLSVVAAIVRAHDATLAIEPRQAGGLTVGVRFPLRPSAPLAEPAPVLAAT